MQSQSMHIQIWNRNKTSMAPTEAVKRMKTRFCDQGSIIEDQSIVILDK